jgi:Putative zinc-finger
MTTTSVPPAIVTSDDNASPHPEDGDVAAYLEAVLPDQERVAFEAHVADCEYCQARLALAGEAVATAPRVNRRRLLYPAALIAAAAGLAAVLLVPGGTVERPAGSEFRSTSESTATQQLHIIHPPRGGLILTNAPELSWSGLGTDALYQITLSTSAGAVLWSERTSDTTATLPAPIIDRLRPSERYFWRVDGLLPNLQSVSTGDQPFSVADQ